MRFRKSVPRFVVIAIQGDGEDRSDERVEPRVKALTSAA